MRGRNRRTFQPHGSKKAWLSLGANRIGDAERWIGLLKTWFIRKSNGEVTSVIQQEKVSHM